VGSYEHGNDTSGSTESGQLGAGIQNCSFEARFLYEVLCPRSGISTVPRNNYSLDNWVSIPGKAKDSSSSLCVLIGSGAHPDAGPMGTGSPFPGSKMRPRHGAHHSPPFSVEVKNEYELLSHWRLHGGAGQVYFAEK
jgi:hypothetical protein